MKDLRRAKWLTAGCAMSGLAAVLAFGLNLPGKETPRRTAQNVNASLQARFGTTSPKASAQKIGVLQRYGQLPLAFEPTAGSNSEAKYLARGNGYALFLANHEAVLELRGPSKSASVVRMELAGANKVPAFVPVELLPGKSNYFIGNDPAKWRTGVPQYRKVLESNVYPGVDLVYYGTAGKLEYDFDVAPGADPSAGPGVTSGRSGVPERRESSSPRLEIDFDCIANPPRTLRRCNPDGTDSRREVGGRPRGVAPDSVEREREGLDRERRLLGLAHLGRGHHLHRARHLRGAPDRSNPAPKVASAGAHFHIRLNSSAAERRFATIGSVRLFSAAIARRSAS